ncbi:hypothetical protein Tco_1487585, partial [Tanacetum coccineum]
MRKRKVGGDVGCVITLCWWQADVTVVMLVVITTTITKVHEPRKASGNSDNHHQRQLNAMNLLAGIAKGIAKGLKVAPKRATKVVFKPPKSNAKVKPPWTFPNSPKSMFGKPPLTFPNSPKSMFNRGSEIPKEFTSKQAGEDLAGRFFGPG